MPISWLKGFRRKSRRRSSSRTTPSNPPRLPSMRIPCSNIDPETCIRRSIPAPLISSVPSSSTTLVENSSDSSSTSDFEEAHLPNFGVVIPNTIYRSALPKAENVSHLETLGLRTIISLVDTPLDEEVVDFINENDIEHICLPFPSHKYGGEEEWVSIELLAEAMHILLDGTKMPVLVHCNKGKHRTGCLIAILRLHMQYLFDPLPDQPWYPPFNDFFGFLPHIIREYAKFAGTKKREADIKFIARHKPRLVERAMASLDLVTPKVEEKEIEEEEDNGANEARTPAGHAAQQSHSNDPSLPDNLIEISQEISLMEQKLADEVEDLDLDDMMRTLNALKSRLDDLYPGQRTQEELNLMEEKDSATPIPLALPSIPHQENGQEMSTRPISMGLTSSGDPLISRLLPPLAQRKSQQDYCLDFDSLMHDQGLIYTTAKPAISGTTDTSQAGLSRPISNLKHAHTDSAISLSPRFESEKTCEIIRAASSSLAETFTSRLLDRREKLESLPPCARTIRQVKMAREAGKVLQSVLSGNEDDGWEDVDDELEVEIEEETRGRSLSRHGAVNRKPGSQGSSECFRGRTMAESIVLPYGCGFPFSFE